MQSNQNIMQNTNEEQLWSGFSSSQDCQIRPKWQKCTQLSTRRRIERERCRWIALTQRFLIMAQHEKLFRHPWGTLRRKWTATPWLLMFHTGKKMTGKVTGNRKNQVNEGERRGARKEETEKQNKKEERREERNKNANMNRRLWSSIQWRRTAGNRQHFLRPSVQCACKTASTKMKIEALFIALDWIYMDSNWMIWIGNGKRMNKAANQQARW